MNTEILEIAKICFELTEEGKAIAFFGFTAHCDYFDISIRPIDDYQGVHPKWNLHGIELTETENSTHCRVGDYERVSFILNEIRDFSMSCEITDEEVYKSEMMAALG